MVLKFTDWQFDVDIEATDIHTTNNSADHCECDYCRNYYDTVKITYPGLVQFLSSFGVNYAGPSELMPFEPTLMLACYRIHGRILCWGSSQMYADDIPISVETADNETFLLWVGEMRLPWVQEIDVNEVVSPANLPEFLARMQDIWYLRHGTELFYS